MTDQYTFWETIVNTDQDENENENKKEEINAETDRDSELFSLKDQLHTFAVTQAVFDLKCLLF